MMRYLFVWPDSEMKFGEAIAPPTRAIDTSKMTLKKNPTVWISQPYTTLRFGL